MVNPALPAGIFQPEIIFLSHRRATLSPLTALERFPDYACGLNPAFGC